MHLFINMQQIRCFNPLPPAQRSAVFFQQRSGRNFPYILVNAIPTLSQSKKHIFPLTLALHGKLILTGTYRRSLCLDLMLLISLTAKEKFTHGNNFSFYSTSCSQIHEYRLITSLSNANNELTQEMKIQHRKKVISSSNLRF